MDKFFTAHFNSVNFINYTGGANPEYFHVQFTHPGLNDDSIFSPSRGLIQLPYPARVDLRWQTYIQSGACPYGQAGSKLGVKLIKNPVPIAKTDPLWPSTLGWGGVWLNAGLGGWYVTNNGAAWCQGTCIDEGTTGDTYALFQLVGPNGGVPITIEGHPSHTWFQGRITPL